MHLLKFSCCICSLCWLYPPWWVAMCLTKLCVQKKKSRETEMHSNHHIHKLYWIFSALGRQLLRLWLLHHKVKNIFFPPLLPCIFFFFFRFPLYYAHIQYVHWVLRMEIYLQSPAPVLWKRKQIQSLFTDWIQMAKKNHLDSGTNAVRMK